MRRMSEDRIRRGELAADVLACDFRLPADSVPCARQQQPSMRARSRALALSPSPARSTRTRALVARSEVIGVRRAPSRALAPKYS
jgi:hypothetical protein